MLEGATGEEAHAEQIRRALARSRHKVPVIGVTGTGGAGKSSLTDELLGRLVRHFPKAQIAVVAMDPTRRRSGGALLGDRIRMNSLAAENVFMRSLATRRAHLATSAVLKDVIELYKAAGFDLVIVETAGIGQSDTEIVDLVDLSLYVMTSEYGAASQLEKIDMLDFADFIVLNKSEKRGAEDSLRDVRKQWRRNHPQQAQLRGRASAGVSDHREPLQRPGRQPPVRRPVRCAATPGRSAARTGACTDAGPTDACRARAARAGCAHPLPRRDRPGRARGARAHRGAGAGRAPGLRPVRIAQVTA